MQLTLDLLIQVVSKSSELGYAALVIGDRPAFNPISAGELSGDWRGLEDALESVN